jgi:pimeloyl-ACP methyl ester carboxylesterase
VPRPREAAPALPSRWPGDRGAHLWVKDREVVLPDGTRVRYAVRGPDGAPWLVFAAGFLCPDNFWRDLAPDLVRDHRIAMINHRGIGASSEAGGHRYPPSPEAYTIPRLAEDVLAVLDAEGAGPAVVLGHSMGVQVALQVAHARPQAVRGLVLVAGAYASPFRTMYGGAAAVAYPFVSMFGSAAPRAFTRRILRLIELPPARRVGIALGAVADHTPWEGMTAYRAHLSRVDPRTAIWTARGMHYFDPTPWLHEVDVPSAIIVGTRDGWCPAEVGVALADALPDANLQVVEGASHTLPLEHPELVLRHIRDVERRAGDGGQYSTDA